MLTPRSEIVAPEGTANLQLPELTFEQYLNAVIAVYGWCGGEAEYDLFASAYDAAGKSMTIAENAYHAFLTKGVEDEVVRAHCREILETNSEDYYDLLRQRTLDQMAAAGVRYFN